MSELKLEVFFHSLSNYKSLIMEILDKKNGIHNLLTNYVVGPLLLTTALWELFAPLSVHRVPRLGRVVHFLVRPQLTIQLQ